MSFLCFSSASSKALAYMASVTDGLEWPIHLLTVWKSAVDCINSHDPYAFLKSWESNQSIPNRLISEMKKTPP